jgi:type IV pilus assembly protein PilX
MKHKAANSKRQGGAVLVVCLVILLIMTVLGISGLQNSTLEMNMSASNKDRRLAFEYAEAQLLSVEAGLVASPPDIKKTYTGCTGNGCFTTGCQKGWCFDGVFTGEDPQACYLVDPTLSSYTDSSENASLWSDNTKYATGTNDTKYIVEFLCYTPKTKGVQAEAAQDLGTDAGGNLVPLYRVSVFAEGPAGRAKLKLQSIVKVAK